MKDGHFKVLSAYFSYILKQYQVACKEHFEVKQPRCEQKTGAFYRIIAQTFSHRDKKQMIVIEQLNQSELITAFAEKISNDPDMIDGFSPRDAHKIGFAAGMASVLGER